MSGLTPEQRDRMADVIHTVQFGETIHRSYPAFLHGEGADCDCYTAIDAILPLLAAAPSDDDLGAAWREAEAALPEGAALVVRYQPWNGYTTVSAAPVERPEPPFVARASGPTPAAALRALAARLREVT